MTSLTTPNSAPSPTKPPTHKKPKIILILGPTGTGKSALALSLSTTLPSEIINLDAMQLYAGLPVITNKIPPSDRLKTPHHLLDMIPLSERAWTVHRYVREADRVIAEVVGRGKVPILVGGTGYYGFGLCVKGATLGKMEGGGGEGDDVGEEGSWEEDGEREEGIEESIQRWPVLGGTAEEMYAELQRLDPEMAESWHPRDRRKVQRSLEICLRTGRKVSQIYREQEEEAQEMMEGLKGEEMGGEDMLRYDPLVLWLQAESRVLKDRLDARVGDMVKDGLFEEVLSMQECAAEQRAQGKEVDKTRGIWISIGYKEMEPWVAEQTANPPPLEEAKTSPLAKACLEAVQASTRQYARRQERYIRCSFAKSLHNAGASDRLLLLDSTDLSKFNTDLVPQAQRLVKGFLADEPLPDPSSLSELARQTFAKVREESPQRSMRVRHHCDVCDRTMMTDSEWQRHMTGRGHKKALQGRKKYEQKLRYFAELAEKREAPQVDVVS